MKIKRTILLLGLIIGFCGLFFVPIASAADCGGKPMVAGQKCCNGVINTFITCGANDGIPDLINLVKDILNGVIGVAAIGALVYAAILYTTAGGSSDNTKKAMTIIRDVIIGIVAYASMSFFLKFIGIT